MQLVAGGPDRVFTPVLRRLGIALPGDVSSIIDVSGSLFETRFRSLNGNHYGFFDRFFNTAAFGRPPQGYYGDAPISPVRGPGVNNWDLTLMKQFKLWNETSSLQFRSEFYNAWNHGQFAFMDTGAVFDPSGAQVNSTFGQLTGNRAPRVIQFSLRLSF